MIFKLGFEDFEVKIRQWNITPVSMVKLIREEYPDYFIFYLPCPEAVYCFSVYKKSLSQINMMNFMAISIKGKRITSEVIPVEKPLIEPRVPKTDIYQGFFNKRR